MTEISFGRYQCRSCGKAYIVNEPGKWLCSPGVCHDCYPACNAAAEFARYCMAQSDSTPAMIALCQFVIRMMDEPLPTTVTEELPKPLFTEAMLFGSLVDWCHETFDLRAYGVSRMADNEQAILVSFSRKPSDDELRALHEVLAGRVTKPVSPQRSTLP